MWTDIVTAIVSLILILAFAYLIVFVLTVSGLYRPNENTIIHKLEISGGGSGSGSLGITNTQMSI
jgi:hypothetical protein